jgi:hypothetical protein
MEMNIGMIVTDLDRTLLRSDKTISDYTVDVLRKCRENGIKVVFATAHPKRSVMCYADIITPDAMILHNGAVTYIGKEILCGFGIPIDVRNAILNDIISEYPQVQLSVEIDDVFYANFDVGIMWQTDCIRTDFNDLTILPDKPADKIIVGVTSLSEINELKKWLPDGYYIEPADFRIGMIMNQKATKWTAIMELSKHFGVETKKTVAFGDDYNDISMIKNCGIGVAVDNAIDEVKKVADYICASNDDDGIAKWLNEHVTKHLPFR